MQALAVWRGTGFLPHGPLKAGGSGKEVGVTAPPCGDTKKESFLLDALKFRFGGRKDLLSSLGPPNSKHATYLKSICSALGTMIIVLSCNDLIFPPFLLENILSKRKN